MTPEIVEVNGDIQISTGKGNTAGKLTPELGANAKGGHSFTGIQSPVTLGSYHTERKEGRKFFWRVRTISREGRKTLMETKTIKIKVDERIIKSLKMYLDLKSAYGTFEGVEDKFCCRIVGALGR